ncbi:(2Fe-2S)-binding protein, partial [Klebsiella pneumoniae]|uniref:(2Fe-2S)-binding protein n=1 Tax=Klebsiella pneumoniae TaxID=573 RepID=UPI00210997EB
MGATLVGDVSKVSFLTQAYDSGLPLPDERVALMFDIGTPDVGVGVAELADDAQVCNCNGVTKGSICKAIKDKGLFTLEEVRKHTKASASCGSCTGLVEQILMFTAGGDYSAT